MKTTILIFAIMFLLFFIHDLIITCVRKKEFTEYSGTIRTVYQILTSILFGIYFNLN